MVTGLNGCQGNICCDCESAGDISEAVLKAACVGHDEYLKELLHKSGADVNVKNKDGETVLIWPARDGNDKCVELLIQAGVDVDMRYIYIWVDSCDVGSTGRKC